MGKEMKWILVNSLLILSIFLGFQKTIQAQNAPVVTAATVLYAVPGQQVTIPITVSNFNNIGSAYLSLDYDPLKLQFVSATSNPLLGGTFNAGDNLIANGNHQLLMSWYNINGASLPNGAYIVNYVFTYLSGSPTLTWFDNGGSCNYTDPLVKNLIDTPTSTYYINGLVCGALPNSVSINGANAVRFGQSAMEYSVPLDPTLTYNWSYTGTGATIVGTSNTVLINFSPTATTGTLKVTASNTCNTSTGTKDIIINSFITPIFTTGPTNVDLRSTGNIYTVQSGMTNYTWSVTGGTITAGGTSQDNSVTITWNIAGVQHVGVKYNDLIVITPETLYPVTVNPATLTLTGVTAKKVYNGNTAVALNTDLALLNGVFEPGTVTLNAVGSIGAFKDKNIGTGKQVTTSGLTLNGPNAGNYTLIQPVITGDITPKALRITAKDVTKCFGLNLIFTGVTFITEGLENTDAVTNVTQTCSGAAPTAISGAYDIVPDNAVGTGLTNYVISYTKGTMTVIPFANQPAGFLVSTPSVCKGDAGVAYTVPNDPFVTYNWSYSGTGVTIHGNTNAVTLDFSLTATSGILSVTASTYCGTSVARTLPITFNTLHNNLAIVFVDKVLSSNVGEGNQWYKNKIPISGATSQNYTPIENGKYCSVISNNCYSDTSNYLDVIITKTEQYINNTIQIFPNPAKDYFTLRYTDAMSETMRMSIFSVDCILIKSYEITNKSVSRECRIDVRHLPSGLYFIRIDTGHKTITKKLIIL